MEDQPEPILRTKLYLMEVIDNVAVDTRTRTEAAKAYALLTIAEAAKAYALLTIAERLKYSGRTR